MRQKSEKIIPAIGAIVLAFVGALVFPLTRASAQGAPVSIQEQLAAQYKVVKMGSDIR